MNPENLAKYTYNAVLNYLKQNTEPNKMNVITEQLKRMFPTWTVMWEEIQKRLLKENPFTNMQHSIQSFAQLFPHYDSFSDNLEQSLAIHDDFWNQVHINLCAVQKGLKC